METQKRGWLVRHDRMKFSGEAAEREEVTLPLELGAPKSEGRAVEVLGWTAGWAKEDGTCRGGVGQKVSLQSQHEPADGGPVLWPWAVAVGCRRGVVELVTYPIFIHKPLSGITQRRDKKGKRDGLGTHWVITAAWASTSAGLC